MINQLKRARIFPHTPTKSPSPDKLNKNIIPPTKSPQFREIENVSEFKIVNISPQKRDQADLQKQSKLMIMKLELEKKMKKKQQSEKPKLIPQSLNQTERSFYEIERRKPDINIKDKIPSNRYDSTILEQKQKEIQQLKNLLKSNEYFKTIRELKDQNMRLKNKLQNQNVRIAGLKNQNLQLNQKIKQCDSTLKFLNQQLLKYKNFQSQAIQQLRRQNEQLKSSLFYQKQNQRRNIQQDYLTKPSSRFEFSVKNQDMQKQLQRVMDQFENVKILTQQFKNINKQNKKYAQNLNNQDQMLMKQHEDQINLSFKGEQNDRKDWKLRYINQQNEKLKNENIKLKEQLNQFQHKFENLSLQLDSSIEGRQSSVINKLKKEIMDLKYYIQNYKNKSIESLNESSEDQNQQKSRLQNLSKYNLELTEQLRKNQNQIIQLKEENKRLKNLINTDVASFQQNEESFKTKRQLQALKYRVNDLQIQVQKKTQTNNLPMNQFNHQQSLLKQRMDQIQYLKKQIIAREQNLYNQNKDLQNFKLELLRTKELLQSCNFQLPKSKQDDKKKLRNVLIIKNNQQNQQLKKKVLLISQQLIKLRHQNEKIISENNHLNNQKRNLFEKALQLEQLIKKYIQNAEQSIKKIQNQNQQMNESLQNSITFQALQILRENLKKIEAYIQKSRIKIKNTLSISH